MKRSTVAAAFACLFLPLVPAGAQDRWADQVREKLDDNAFYWDLMGYAAVGDVTTGTLGQGQTATSQVFLEAGTSYVISAVCDDDCSDLDLRLYAGDGSVADEDLEVDDFAMVWVDVDGSGSFQVEVIMEKCANEPCRWGFGVFGVPTSELGGTGGPDASAAPTYGTIDLSSGFSPDPYEQSVPAGGEDEVTLEGAACSGYVNAQAPDVDLRFTAGTLPLHIYAKSTTDITLVVNTPSGEWLCSDDANGTDPHVQVGQPESGTYNIWIGTFSAVSGKLPSSVLYISEVDPRW